MQENWLRLDNKWINMDHVTHITEEHDRYNIYLVHSSSPLAITRNTSAERALAYWLETSVAPMTDGTEAIPFG